MGNFNSTKKKLTFIDLFAGIGGIRIAFENVGATCVYSSEWDKDAQLTYAANFGETPDGDITKVNPNSIPDHDILTGGFPCQSFSIIGKREGLRDTRGTMFFEVEKILKAKQPYAFLLENVKQLVTIDGGETFKTMLTKLNELGYYVHWKVLNALDYGMPQKRERVLIVGFKQNHPFEFPHKREMRKSLKDILEPEDKIDPKHYISDAIKAKLAIKVTKNYDYPTIWHENKSGNIGIHDYSCALRANASYNYLLVNGKRRLTSRENLRLMGFPDNFKIVVPHTSVRKQAGNSVVIPVIQAVAEQMIEAFKKEPVKEKIQNIEKEIKKVQTLLPLFAEQIKSNYAE
jgi:DNA (cytosine-5)-methyltransferase 1